MGETGVGRGTLWIALTIRFYVKYVKNTMILVFFITEGKSCMTVFTESYEKMYFYCMFTQSTRMDGRIFHYIVTIIGYMI